MSRAAAALLAALALAAAPGASAASYAERADVREFIAQMVERHGFVEKELAFLFARARRRDAILQAIRPTDPGRTRSWREYRELFVSPARIAAGTEFWRAHRAVLERARRSYGVPEEIVAAIIGVETFYGRHTGRWRVVDALATLAFDYPPRADFFRAELESFLVYARDADLDVFSVRGSYAGAIGIPQFMPGSYLRYAVDFDGNGVADLRASPADAIGSVANFLEAHGWRAEEPVALGAAPAGEAARALADGSVTPKHTLEALRQAGVRVDGAAPDGASGALIELATPGEPSEYRVGLQNFWVLTRYNRSSKYAAAVLDLAAQLRAAAPQEGGR